MGGDSEVSIDRVNQWMRSQPWYLAQLRAWGQNPASVRLNKSQASMLLRLAQANGVQIDQGAIEVDAGGNLNPKGHKLRNTLIGAGVTAAALTGAGALGAGPMAGLFGSSSAPALLAGAPTGAALPGLLPAVGAPSLLAGAPTGAALPGLLPAVRGAAGNAIKNVAKQATGGGTDWVSTLAPLIGLGTQAATGGFSTPKVGIDPGLQSQLQELITRQTSRAQQSAPLYEAAMKLAQSMAPTATTTPRLQSAIQASAAPVRQPDLNPQVADALGRLMGGR